MKKKKNFLIFLDCSLSVFIRLSRVAQNAIYFQQMQHLLCSAPWSFIKEIKFGSLQFFTATSTKENKKKENVQFAVLNFWKGTKYRKFSKIQFKSRVMMYPFWLNHHISLHLHFLFLSSTKREEKFISIQQIHVNKKNK